MIFKKLFSISLPLQVIIAVIVGVLTGLLIGDKAVIFEPIGRIYTMLMETVVFPYIMSTLLVSLGDLSPSLSIKLLKKIWVYFLLLLLTYGTLIILAQAIPLGTTLSTYEQTNVPQQSGILDFLLPENLFYDLTNNYIPAVVIFCILFGFILQLIPNKSTLFSVLETISDTCLLFWNRLVKFAPIATFALLAYISGTIKFNQLYDLSIFLILFLIGILLLIFWIIPITISSFTNIRYKEILPELRDALIISAITTLSVVALPYIQKTTEKFIAHKKYEVDTKENKDIIKTILLINYPLAQLGNFFVYLFILFASLYFNSPINNLQYIFLPVVSYLSSIGSPSSSINSVAFLANWVSLPIDTVNLYMSLLPLIRYGQVLLSVMGFAFISIIGTFVFFGYARINYKKIAGHFIVAYALLFMLTFALKSVFPNPGEKNYTRLNSFSLSRTLVANTQATIMPSFDEKNISSKESIEDALFRIQRTGVLRVGFNADMRPFAFYNKQNQLVGYDIAYAYALAKALNSRLEFIPFTWQYLVRDLTANKFDIAMSAIYATEQRLTSSMFTRPYFHSPVSLIVPKDKQNQFQTADQIKNMEKLRIGVFNDPVLIPLIQKNFPNARIVILPNISGNAPAQAFEQNLIDAILWSQAQTQVWVLAHPDYVSVVPSGVPAPFLIAYMVQRNSPQLLNFLNYWLTLKKNDGFQKKMYNQWILIRPSTDHQPRWSIWRSISNRHGSNQ
ncbi:cation:dicarboxylate symporter family transporter [Legionella resiliens]|uniref:Transporter substrate-binding domain-containing protein n=1 Tax=Legionella resiliens TaxID=2905958 RepID=A0ABS8X2Y7_9GAMM|nr:MULTISPECIES: cation:dicarboxylase symporter family transporter [unclassified Legionella]MCE0723186.1 transporter substrate-binding domain-containing protein [Legionella sp. 9fVS26]MCE3532339.1 transporter substrate-binding domain-containing protein [Legionella sp. 8cVS16]